MSKTSIQQALLILAGVGLVIGLYFFGDTKTRPVTEAKGPMQGGEMPDRKSSMSFDKLLELAKGTLTRGQKDSIALVQRLVDNSPASEKVKSLEKLANVWARTQNLIVSGHYFEEAAKLDSTKDKWKIAGDYYFVGLQNTGDSAAKLFAGQRSFECYAIASKFDTTDTKLKVLEAVSLIDGVGNVMSGVLLLKEVEKTDPDNELMNVTLGRLAIVSGQYPKAITRLERMIKLYPKNTEVYFHLGEAYRATGQKNEAIKMFEKCKELEKSPSFQKQLDEYINQIKN